MNTKSSDFESKPLFLLPLIHIFYISFSTIAFSPLHSFVCTFYKIGIKSNNRTHQHFPTLNLEFTFEWRKKFSSMFSWRVVYNMRIFSSLLFLQKWYFDEKKMPFVFRRKTTTIPNYWNWIRKMKNCESVKTTSHTTRSFRWAESNRKNVGRRWENLKSRIEKIICLKIK